MTERLHPRACLVCPPGTRQPCARCGSRFQHVHITIHDRTGASIASEAACRACLTRFVPTDPETQPPSDDILDDPVARQIVEVIADHIDIHGVPPSWRHLSVTCGVAMTTIANRLARLEEAGWLRRTRKIARGITLIHRPHNSQVT